MKTIVPFLIICLLASCQRNQRNTISIEVEGESTSNTTNVSYPSEANVKIYFENTHSMDGYINGNTQFKDVLRELLVLVENNNDVDFETEFYLLNNELNKVDFGVESIKISDKLSQNSTYKIGNKNSSDFEEVLNQVLENHGSDEISILMADFIYSPKEEKDIPSALNKLKTYTKNAFLKAGGRGEGLETRVYSFSSDFNGIYYDINNTHITGIRTRPYYYFVIAPKELMIPFEKEIISRIKKTDTYQNEAVFTTSVQGSIPMAILTSTGNNGRIKTRSGAMEVISYPKNGNLEFIALLDLHRLAVGSEYILDKNNYQLGNPEFAIDKIGLVNGKFIEFDDKKLKMSASTQLSIKNSKYTHAITFKAGGLISDDLTLTLRKKIPAWVKEVHSEGDLLIRSDSLEQSRTFGFGYLMEGVSEAYLINGGNNKYFDIRIPVK